MRRNQVMAHCKKMRYSASRSAKSDSPPHPGSEVLEDAAILTPEIAAALLPKWPSSEKLRKLARRSIDDVLEHVESGAFTDCNQISDFVSLSVELWSKMHSLLPFYKEGAFSNEHQELWQILCDTRHHFDSEHEGSCAPGTFEDFPQEGDQELENGQCLGHNALACLRQKELVLKKLVAFLKEDNDDLVTQFKSQLQLDVESESFPEKVTGLHGPSLI